MNLEDFIGTLVVTILLVGILGIPLFCLFGFNRVIEYHFNKSTCAVLIEDKTVYKGLCHFVEVSPVGEMGKSKEVIIYKDSRRWIPLQRYITEDVVIKEL